MAQLNEQQKYLLNRLPNRYDFKITEVSEPSEVKQARKIIAAFTERVDKQGDERKRKFHKSLVVAREAIYFKPANDALKVVRDLEAEFPEVFK